MATPAFTTALAPPSPAVTFGQQLGADLGLGLGSLTQLIGQQAGVAIDQTLSPSTYPGLNLSGAPLALQSTSNIFFYVIIGFIIWKLLK